MILKINILDVSHEMVEGVVISIGRIGHGADIEIDNESVSRQHADIKLEDGKIKIFDRKSKNNTFVNGTKIDPEIWHALTEEDKVNIVGYTINFIASAPVPVPVPVPTPPAAPKPSPAPDKTNSPANINTKFRQLLSLKLSFTIGRHNDNNIALPDVTPDDKIVSRSHAEITFKAGKYWIEDLDSKNGTYINEERIPSRQPRVIENKDMVLIHLHYFNLVEGYRDLREEVAIRAEGIGKTYPSGFVGLNPMTVEIPYKQIVALMGPSGCGKSTLLKALNGDNPASSGNVYIHGLSLRENYQLLKSKIGYVPQDDTIHSELTVEKTLYLAAKLRLPDDTQDDDIKQRIIEVLTSLNLGEGIRNKMVGKLSGGQRKRICIAVELLTRPTILFLDEPTSPLDPETVEEFLVTLRSLASNGTTIIMVTHKPDDLNFVDKVIFMAAKGYFVYYGDKTGLLKRFNVDHIIKVYTQCGNDHSVAKYYIKPTAHIAPRPFTKDIHADKKNSLLLQFYWLSKRYLNIKMNDRYNLFLLLAQPLIISILIAFIFRRVNISVMMLIAISGIWFGVSNSSKEIVGEFAIYKRERMFNLNINTYILSKWAVLSLIALVQVILFISIIHLKFGRQDPLILGSYLQNVGYMFYIASSSTLFGLFLSSYFTTTEKVLTVVPIALMPQIMLAGVVEPLRNVYVDILSYFTFGRWGTEGFLRLQHFPAADPAASRLITHPAPMPMPAPPTFVDSIFYNEALKNNGGKIVTLFNSIQANIFVILIISMMMYLFTYLSMKKKDTI